MYKIAGYRESKSEKKDDVNEREKRPWQNDGVGVQKGKEIGIVKGNAKEKREIGKENTVGNVVTQEVVVGTEIVAADLEVVAEVIVTGIAEGAGKSTKHTVSNVCIIENK